MNVTIDDVLQLGDFDSAGIDAVAGKALKGVSTDSRTILPGQVFFALRGESFDGHEYIRQALARGAILAVVDRRAPIEEPFRRSTVVVEDTTRALGRLANSYRKKFNVPILAVAGSNGKTTTKEMIAAVLGTQLSVLRTKGNLNNHIGVPMTLFRLDGTHDVGVVEIGTNHPGELSYLCGVLEPTHGIITNVGHEHMEFFKDLDGVARGEGELFAALGSTGIAYVNMDDPRVVAQAEVVKKQVTYGYSGVNVDVRGTFLSMNNEGCVTFSVAADGAAPFGIRLAIPGKHMMVNALAAAAVGLSHGISPENIQRALEQVTAANKRMEVVTVRDVTILNDTYNANPDSVVSALETLDSMECRGKKVVVLADMLELGESSVREHQRIGTTIKRMGFQHLLSFGPMARHIHEKAEAASGIHFEAKARLSEHLVRLVRPGDIVLVKGSRGMKMEELVILLQKKLGENVE
jgi:UDP-N-acetylmuramoyl-tripeptide--D-alanyl-D-alanine ligase